MIKALDLCIAEVSPGGRLVGPVLTAASAGSSKRQRPRRNAVSSHRCSSAESCKHAEPQA